MLVPLLRNSKFVFGITSWQSILIVLIMISIKLALLSYKSQKQHPLGTTFAHVESSSHCNPMVLTKVVNLNQKIAFAITSPELLQLAFIYLLEQCFKFFLLSLIGIFIVCSSNQFVSIYLSSNLHIFFCACLAFSQPAPNGAD